jgi:hypothetical protein
MKNLNKTLVYLSTLVAVTFSWGMSHAQVFDTPIIYETLPGFLGGDDMESFPNTLQVGEMDSNFINPISGEPLNEVVFVFNPLQPTFNIGGAGLDLSVRFFTFYHTSETDTRALSLSNPADLIYPPDKDNVPFVASSSVQILDLDRDGQNDLAFNGYPDEDDCNFFTCGPAPTLGVLGTGSDPFVAGQVDMIGRTKNRYSAPFPSFFGAVLLSFSQLIPYSGMPTLAPADLNGDTFTDLVINDWDFGSTIGTGVNGAGPMNAGQMLRAFPNNGSLGPLTPIDSMINILPPANLQFSVPFYIVSDDFDMNGMNDAAVIYVIEEDDNEFAIRLMVFDGEGDGSFNANPSISLDVVDQLPPDGLFLNAFTYGDFEGNGYLDFAVSYVPSTSLTPKTAIVTCAPGPDCQVQTLDFPNQFLPISIDAGDFDGDGLDDLVQLELGCNNGTITNCNGDFLGQISAYLNQGGSFNTEPDQTIIPPVATDGVFGPMQVIARDIDGCSPEDIAFTGIELPTSAAGQGPPIPILNLGRGGVAFAAQAEITADAGEGIPTDSGIQIGGNPTCMDSAGNPFNIQWTQISGEPAILSDPTAANPIVTDLSTESTFQVTCQTACGEATDTVTVNIAICITGSGNPWDTIRDGCAGCSLNRATSRQAPLDLGFLVLGLLIGMNLLGARRRKQVFKRN